MGNNVAIETFNLSKSFKLKSGKNYIDALKDVSISINEGEKFGLIGPNGAGKTTLIQILTTLQQPSNGYAKIYDYNILRNPSNIRRLIGLMLGSEMLYYRITGYANLKFFCKIYKIRNFDDKIVELSKEFEIEKWLNQYVEHYSSGMKMKLALCRILLLNPKILFLDEPTLGLDVKTTNFMVNKLKNLEQTIFITSHDLTSMDKLCDRIGFIREGQIIRIGDKEEIKRLLQTKLKINIMIYKNKEVLNKELISQDFIINVELTREGFVITLKSREDYSKLLGILSRFEILKVKEEDFTLEDLFFKLL